MDILYRILASLKAVASLVGAIATALSLTYTDNETLTIIVIVATALVTWSVPNIDPEGRYQRESVQPTDDALVNEPDDGLTYEESGGMPYPTDYDEGSLYKDTPEAGDPDRY